MFKKKITLKNFELLNGKCTFGNWTFCNWTFVSGHFVGVPSTKKKVRKFPVPSRDATTKLSLGGNNDVITELFLPRGSLVSDIPAGDGKLVNLFLRCWHKPIHY
jgi:hypothetical protein